MHQAESLKKYYTLLPTALGVCGIVWHEREGTASIVRIFLPEKRFAIEKHIKLLFPGSRERSCAVIHEISSRIQQFAAGETVDFDFELLDMTVCSPFQKRVLLTEAKIPRGFISTYGRIAARLGMPAGARAVGHALAMNPFPLIMPCHRTVGSHGALSGFQGGLEMKRTLLLQEGIKFLKTGKAIMNKVYFLQGKPSPLAMVP